MTISLTFPDGAKREFPSGITGVEIAKGISPSLLKRTVAMALDGTVVDLADPITADAKIELLNREDPRALELIRHDTAHVLAEAVQELFPGTQVTIGPVIENGFFYDFARNEPFTPEDFPAIEKKMREIIARDKPFTKEVWSRDKAKDFFAAKGEAYKVELVDAIPADQTLKMYAQGDWIDLCRGPHMTSVGKVGNAFKLMKVAGAYWRGDSNNAMLTRIYGTAFAPAEIAITSGCNQAYVVTMMALARAGDNVLLPTPWYFNHEMTLTMLGVEPRPLPCTPGSGFVPDVETAEALIDERTRAIVLVTPNNPTGAVYPPETIAAFAALCARRGLWLVLDETYRDFLPEGVARPHEMFAASGWQDSVIGLYSFSKAYAVPGWRLGAITAGERVIAQIGKVLGCVQISPVRAGQAAVTWGIDGIRAWRERNRAEINDRASLFREAMAPLNGWRVLSAGAYFAYVAHPFAGAQAAAVARRLAEERGVLALPGPYFGPGQEDHLRIAIANVAADRIGLLGERLAGLSA